MTLVFDPVASLVMIETQFVQLEGLFKPQLPQCRLGAHAAMPMAPRHQRKFF
jgi:hypothetical protein